MFCPQCGSKQPDDAQFCAQCGAPLSAVNDAGEAAEAAPTGGAKSAGAAAETAAAPTPAESPEPEAAPASPAAPAGEPAATSPAPAEKPKRKNHRTAIIAGAVAAALVCGGGIGGFMWWQGEQERIAEEARVEAEQKAAYEAAHQTYPITLEIQCDGLDTSTGTKIPLHVTGTDFEGNEVDELFFTDQNATGVELMRGDYTFDIPASPIAADGTIYDVSASGAAGLGGRVDDDGSFLTQNALWLDPIDAADVTDDEIEAAYDMAVQGGCKNADELRDAAYARRDEALAKDALGAYEAASYSFTIPEQWIGRVEVTIDGDDVTITPSGQPDHLICELEVIQGELHSAGDISVATQAVCDLGDRTVVAQVRNYCYIIPQALDSNSTNPDDFYTQNEAEELVSLETLSAYTYDDALAGWENNPGVGITGASDALFDYLKQSVTAK
ncbi:zinc ribbon domain-containing protein [[Collinsella] massiliensis]|uniref:Zinc-ribbon domain-containing protein n=1 Tax=[Collinsella] massiliensis TaxID=1232426 RepID=A0A1Y3XM28_9ACTN|nr:zinc ribbon domain-containing protein [[Collinsella] massiliensis]OUN86585.1 hypothetical protein B5G02_08525 [[Collinsella] massiliensis]